MKLLSPRLLLVELTSEHLDSIHVLRSSDEVNKFLDRDPHTSLSDTKAFLTKIIDGNNGLKWYYWAITSKVSRELIGTICLWNFTDENSIAELGYELIPEYQRKGYMKEALEIVLRFAFQEIKLVKILAETHEANTPSIKLLKSHGFKEVKKMKSFYQYELRNSNY